MSFGALNAAALNRVVFNGAAGAVFVLASASFTAEATVTSVPTLNGELRGDIACGVNVSFDAFGIRAAFCNFTGTATPVFIARSIFGNSTDWTVSSTFQPLVYTLVPGAINLEAGATIEIIASDKLGNFAWTAGSEVELIPNKDGALRGALIGTAVSSFGTPDRNRGVTGSWSANAEELWVEADTTTGGITTFSAHMQLAPGATFTTDNNLTGLFINGSFIAVETTWDASVIHNQAGRGPWTMESVFGVTSALTTYGFQDVAASLSMAVVPSLNQKGAFDAFLTSSDLYITSAAIGQLEGSWVAASTAEFIPLHNKALSTELLNDCTMTWDATRTAYVIANWTLEATMLGVPYRILAGAADWDGLASTISGAVIVSLVPAPQSRTFKISTHTRRFALSKQSKRTFEVST